MLSWLTLHCSKPCACRRRKLCSDQPFACILNGRAFTAKVGIVRSLGVDCHPLMLRVGWHHVTARLASGFRLLHSSMRLALRSYTSLGRALKPHSTPDISWHLFRALSELLFGCRTRNCSRPFARLPAISRAAHEHGAPTTRLRPSLSH